MAKLSVIILITVLAIIGLLGCTPSQTPTAPPSETPSETAPPGTTAPGEAAATPSEPTPSEPSPSETTPTSSLEDMTITVKVNEAGKVLLAPSGNTHPQGTEVTLTAVPKSGYYFVKWSGDISESNNPTTIKMDSDKYIVAVFEAIPTYTLNITINPIRKDCDGGSVTLSPAGGTYESGATVTLTTLSSPDTYFTSYSFIAWSGDISGTSPTITITIDSDKSVTASFKEIWVCPHCEGAEFDTIEELQDHIRAEHPGERLPIIIEWD